MDYLVLFWTTLSFFGLLSPSLDYLVFFWTTWVDITKVIYITKIIYNTRRI
jgi:hypothetical protein